MYKKSINIINIHKDKDFSTRTQTYTHTYMVPETPLMPLAFLFILITQVYRSAKEGKGRQRRPRKAGVSNYVTENRRRKGEIWGWQNSEKRRREKANEG